ncbi:MAG: glycine--tRNA ligase subunit beta [Rhodospirillaceae bacterium]
MAELLLEILSEEIPARMQARAADDLKRLVCDGLKAAGLEFQSAEAFATPRRLALVVDGLPEKQPDVSEERRGPRADAPERAMAGFKGSLPEGAVIEERETPKGTFLFATVEIKGRETAEVLGGILEAALADLHWPKSMRWADFDLRWVRPIHSMIALFAGRGVAVRLGPVAAATSTAGHRFMAPARFEVASFADYRDKLLDAKVMLEPAKRRAQIAADAERLAAAEGLTVKADTTLLDEVTGLVEWPVVLIGRIDEQFMDLPPEVLTTSMRSHQKYFSCLDADGELAARFIVVANMETTDEGAAIVAGNERVLRARLADAKFFWDQDRKTSLASKAPALKDRVFHAKLGTMDEKVDRMQALAADIAGLVKGADKDRVRSAARLAKADLSTGMVGEFPELQGVMGCYYARHDGESDEVCDAIAEHYSPLGPNDACPSKPESVCVALADKIDSLVGFFAIDEKPTGSKDPFALRRAALGVIRLVLENKLRLPLLAEFSKAAGLIGKGADPGADLLVFFADRLKVHLREQGVKHDHIDAVFALKDESGGGEDDLVRLMDRVEALSEFLASDDGGNLLTAYKRAANILKIEEKKDGRAYAGAPDAAAFQQDEERALASGLDDARPAIEKALAAEDFAGAMAALAKLRGPVDAFFDAVTVNADDAKLRENRLKLLNGIRAALEGVADFSRIEG